jgi:hypothetical protein
LWKTSHGLWSLQEKVDNIGCFFVNKWTYASEQNDMVAETIFEKDGSPIYLKFDLN